MVKDLKTDRFEGFFQNLPEPSFVGELLFEKELPDDIKFIEINKAFEKLISKEASEILQKTSAEIYGIKSKKLLSIISRVVANKKKESINTFIPFFGKNYQIDVGNIDSNLFYVKFTDLSTKEASTRKTEERLRSLVNILQHKYSDFQEMLDYALEEAISLTKSKIGYIYHYSEKKEEFVLNTWSKEVMPECSVVNPQSCYELSKTGLWGEAVRQRKTIILNDFNRPNPYCKGVPKGHVKLYRFLTVPIFVDDKIVGVVGVANKDTDYDELDSLQLELLMDAVWKLRQQRETEQELRQIEWMLSKSPQVVESKDSIDYGLIAQNPDGLILSSINPQILENMASDYLDMLNTSSVIYELDGKIAFSAHSSEWCKLLYSSSKKLCNTDDDRKARLSGKWLCHESSWCSCCQQAITEEKEIDIRCSGGLRLYAVPIRIKRKIIGVISLSYSSPPKDQAELKQIADLYKIPYDKLEKAAKAYLSRPAYIIEMAKRRTKTIAQLIAALVDAQEAEKKLLHAIKMEAVGRLAGGVAHDFNNMLGVILGHAEMAMMELENPELIKHDIENIIAAGQRSAKLTQQLLAFARKQTFVPQTIDVNQTILSNVNMLKRLIGENIELSFRPSSKVLPIKLDPTQLDQILINLVVNARTAISGSGRVLIRTGLRSIDNMELNSGPNVPNGQYTYFSVSDTGCGMSSEIRSQIFEPFFTTQKNGKGTGLGLSTVYGIVNQNNGTIDVYSEPGKGTTFKVFFPVNINNATLPNKTSEDKKIHYGKGTILLVEDELPLLKLTNSMLTRLGYKVLSANSPLDAIDLVKESDEEIDLILSDVIMPKINGSQMYDEILKIRPDIKCLFMSGYTADIIADHGSIKEGYVLLEKPFNLSTLSQKLSEVLNK